MTAKKRSFHKFSKNLNNSNDLNISWSNSDSDDNPHGSTSKKCKNTSERWITLEYSSQKSELPHDTTPIDEDSTGNLINGELVQPDDDRLKPSSSGRNRNFCESPIIGRLKLEELSPVLGSSRSKIKKSLLNRKKLINQKVKRTLIEIETMPLSQQSNPIIDSRSPTPDGASQYVIISSSQASKSPLNLSIESASSHPGSEIVVFNIDSAKSSSGKSSVNDVLYTEPPPKRKIKYKKDGLAHQLQKALHNQRTNCAIWRHELYLKKSSGYQVSSSYDESLILLLRIRKHWKEFGVTMVECEHLESDNLQKCVVVIGFNVTHAVCLDLNSTFKLYPPYKTTSIKYNDDFISCHFNVSRILCTK